MKENKEETKLQSEQKTAEEFVKRQVGDAYQYFPHKFKAYEIFEFMDKYAQFKSQKPQ